MALVLRGVFGFGCSTKYGDYWLSDSLAGWRTSGRGNAGNGTAMDGDMPIMNINYDHFRINTRIILVNKIIRNQHLSISGASSMALLHSASRSPTPENKTFHFLWRFLSNITFKIIKLFFFCSLDFIFNFYFVMFMSVYLSGHPSVRPSVHIKDMNLNLSIRDLV